MAVVRAKSDPGGLLTDVAFLPMEAVGDRGDFDRGSVRSRREIGAGYTYFEDGDVLRAKVTPCFENGKGAAISRLVGGCGFGSTELVALRPRAGVDQRFLYYLLMSQEFTTQGTGYLYGAHGVKRVPEKQFRDFVAWSPPEQTQRAIADYLDVETSRIDSLIDDKQRLIALVAEREMAVKTRLVLIDEDRRPYPRTRLKFLSPRVSVGLVINPSTYAVDEGVPYLHGSHVVEGRIIFDPPKYMSDQDSKMLSGSRLHTGDVIVVRAGYPGQAAVIPPEYEGANCASVIVIRRGNRVLPEYLAAFLNSADGARQVALVQYGAAQEQINVGHIVHFQIPTPTLPQQRKITARIDAECGRLGEARRKLRHQVDLLRERRGALITAACNGTLIVAAAA
jgi:type I restriction enzyme S subunit